MHIHILGICGTFMGGVAVIAQQAGHRVTGCDSNVYPPMSDQLRAVGIDLVEGYAADQIAIAPDVWVIGNVVTRGNPLMEAILDRGDRYVSGPQWLSDQILIDKWVLAVAGTHGKTTTASMLAWILERTGSAPSYLIGGIPVDFERSGRLTTGRHFVIEGDEYDTAFFDKRSKFLHYRPRTAILNNIEFDHADIFDDLAAIERQFHHLVRILPRSGRIIANGRDEAVKRVLTVGCWTPVEQLGVPDGWEAGAADRGGSFDVAWQGRVVGRLRGQMAGEHNRMNALAAVAAARHAGVDPADSVEALGSFRGVKRRMETRGSVGGVTVYDDFAHHPTAIRATVAALRQLIGRARILAVLEPRSNTMKRGVMKDALPESLREADRVFVYAAGLGWNVDAVFGASGLEAWIASDLDALVEAIAREVRAGDHVLVMSNGAFGGIHGKLLERLAERR